ncbi:MAG: alpha/beta hydrolase [Holosporales bacterium]|jgi:acetyl esterase|nr:alpha/beta hydrolase [Holosporales bacterium]
MLYETKLSAASQKIVEALAPSENFTYETLKAMYDNLKAGGHSIDITRQIANQFFIDHTCEKAPVEEVKDFCVKDVNENHEVPVRLYSIGSSDDVLMFIHGGGYIQGNLETHDSLCRRLANALKVNVLSVGYRLAPETLFPAQLDDLLGAYIWCANKAGKNSKLIIAGDSAGGNLCAALCLKLHDVLYDRKPDAQILFYASLTNNFESPSFNVFRRGYGLTVDWIKYYIYLYTGEKLNNPELSNNKYLYPGLAEDASVFPKTVVVSASCDVLLDGQLEFISKLESANVPVQHINVDGAVHSFMNYSREFVDEVPKVLSQISQWLEKQLG